MGVKRTVIIFALFWACMIILILAISGGFRIAHLCSVGHHVVEVEKQGDGTLLYNGNTYILYFDGKDVTK
jgi:hypothetical protein